MRTLILREPGQIELIQTEEPNSIAAAEALVRVHSVGVCGTDIHAFRGRQPFFSYPRILGHELSVEIVALGSPHAHLQIGDRCAVEPYLNCGQCRACQRGKTNCCTSLQVLGVHTDGGMRELICLPVSKLHRANDLSWNQLALVETLGIGAHAVQRAQLTSEDRVLIVGAGPIGLTVVQFSLLAGIMPTIVDIEEGRLNFCRTHLDAESTVRITSDDPQSTLELLKEKTKGDLFDVVFDATGNSASMHQSFSYVNHGGRLVFVGLFNGEVSFHDPDFHRREMTLLSSRNAIGADFARIISLIQDSQINTTPWITHHCQPQAFSAELPQWLTPDSQIIKGIVNFAN